AHAETELVEPARRRFRTVKMNLADALYEVMRKALCFERRAAADEHRILKHCLKRDDDLLPGTRSARPAVDAARWLFEPARAYIMTEELPRITSRVKPSGIYQKAL